MCCHWLIKSSDPIVQFFFGQSCSVKFKWLSLIREALTEYSIRYSENKFGENFCLKNA